MPASLVAVPRHPEETEPRGQRGHRPGQGAAEGPRVADRPAVHPDHASPDQALPERRPRGAVGDHEVRGGHDEDPGREERAGHEVVAAERMAESPTHLQGEPDHDGIHAEGDGAPPEARGSLRAHAATI